MTTAEERVKILKMIEEEKINAEEGARLLRALGKQERKRSVSAVNESGWLRVHVTDLDSGKSSVNVNVPMRLVNVGLRLGARFVPDMEGLDVEELADALQQGLTGKIIDVIDKDQGQRVEVFVE
ncbi:MAG TPA: hypothetical protein G4O08_02985 [Anaerolineae bacterium]|nr:hypothetical protein [Anaerolineae bacterium]